MVSRMIPVVSPGTTRGWPLRLLRGNSSYKNLPREAQRPKCCLYKMPYSVAAPVRETGDVIAHLQEPEFFFVSQVMHAQERPSSVRDWHWLFCKPRKSISCRSLHWASQEQVGSRVCVSPETRLIIVLAPMSLLHEEATCKSSTINGLLYAHETLIVAQRCDGPRDWLWDACHMAGVCWGSCCEGFRSKEGPHYCFMRSARNMTINLTHEWKSLGDSIPKLYCVA